jgi:hypothetical protein
VDIADVTVRAVGLLGRATLCGVTDIQYALSVRQRLIYLALGLTFVVAAGISWEAPAGQFLGAAGLLLVLAFFAYGFVGATIDGSGIQVRGPLPQRISWNQVANVTTTTRLGSTSVMIHLGGGRRHRLLAPFTAPLQRDHDFEAKFETIRHCWQHSTGQLAS